MHILVILGTFTNYFLRYATPGPRLSSSLYLSYLFISGKLEQRVSKNGGSGFYSWVLEQEIAVCVTKE